ncbi:MAG: hypothetical protein ABEJ79_02410 [Halolamina sp.]
MVTVADFVVRLVTSVVDLVRIFLFEVALSDPLTFLTFAVGATITTGAIAVGGYVALGVLARELGVTSPTPSRPQSPPQRAE